MVNNEHIQFLVDSLPDVVTYNSVNAASDDNFRSYVTILNVGTEDVASDYNGIDSVYQVID
ncbi:MAG: hypothetical protein KBT33_01205 [Prevotellaceae bacterium]|nr:hypothetical protein [Candidatus Minthosoma equi]